MSINSESYWEIDTLVNQIRNQIYYYSNDICYCLIDFRSIWSIIGFNITLKSEEINMINQYITRINKILYLVNEEYNYYIIDELDNKDFFISKFNEIFKVKNEFINYIYKIKNINKTENRIFYYKKHTDKWFEKTIFIFLKYEGYLPVHSNYLFQYLKNNWNRISIEEQQFIIYICEDILGGINLDFISKNFNNWIKMNILDKNILEDFILF